MKEYSSYYKQNHDSGEELQFESFSIEAYCGTYNDFIAIQFKAGVMDFEVIKKYTIGDYTFIYPNSTYELPIWEMK